MLPLTNRISSHKAFLVKVYMGYRHKVRIVESLSLFACSIAAMIVGFLITKLLFKAPEKVKNDNFRHWLIAIAAMINYYTGQVLIVMGFLGTLAPFTIHRGRGYDSWLDIGAVVYGALISIFIYRKWSKARKDYINNTPKKEKNKGPSEWDKL